MSLVNFFIAARRSFADWRRRQRAYDELMALDDHCLADLGIERSQINAYLAKGPRQAEMPAASARAEAVFAASKPA